MTLWEVILIGVSLSMDAFAVSVADGMVLSVVRYTAPMGRHSPTIRKRAAFLIALTFGVFQAVMPMAGYALVMLCGRLGQAAYDALHRYGHWVAMALLCLLGGKMIVEGMRTRSPRYTPQGSSRYNFCPRESRLGLQKSLDDPDNGALATGIASQAAQGGSIKRGDTPRAPNAMTNTALTPITLLAQGVATSIDALAVGISLGAVGGEIVRPALVIGAVTTVICLAGVYLGRRAERLLGRWATVVGGAVLVAIGVKMGVAP